MESFPRTRLERWFQSLRVRGRYNTVLGVLSKARNRSAHAQYILVCCNVAGQRSNLRILIRIDYGCR